ncbi:N-acetylmuramoyl-L-alanine amidase [Paraburkholderia fungorum]|jgi:hypothetical protein|uniref:peptidoglycan recognition protein family protein n=1 Tax=Paraburkholderia fungorum TaxID=134537 RepID=UPI0004874E4F
MSDYHYTPEHWSTGDAVSNYKSEQVVPVTVNDRAATRQAIITALKKSGYSLVERSSWEAKPPKNALKSSNWDYSDVVIHHAGHSYACAVNEQGAIEQMKKAQEYDLKSFDDIGYHYAVSCNGEIFEARDVRFVGSHVAGDNTGKLGIVLLENLAEAGEAWEQEYSRKSFWQKVKGSLDIGRDAIAFDHAMPTKAQIDALVALISALKEFFNLKALGGHREYQLLAPGNEGRACPGKYGMQVVTQMRGKFGLPAPSK